MAIKLQKLQRSNNSGVDVSWKTLRNKFDLQSDMVGKLRNEGLMIYENRSFKFLFNNKAIF